MPPAGRHGGGRLDLAEQGEDVDLLVVDDELLVVRRPSARSSSIGFEMPVKIGLVDCFDGVHGGVRLNIGMFFALSNAFLTLARVMSVALASRITLTSA